MADYPMLITILAMSLALIGLVNWLRGARLVHAALDRVPQNPAPSLSLGHHVLATAGIGQFILAAVIVLLADDPIFLTGNYLFAGVLYLVFVLIRSVTMRKLSQKISRKMAFGVCLAIHLLWPILAVLFIPLSLVDLGNRKALPEGLNTTQISGYAKET